MEVWRVDMKEGCGEGETRRGTTGRGRLGGCNGEGETGKGATGGDMGRGRRGGGDGEGDDGEGDNGEGEVGRVATRREGKEGGKHIECLGGMRLHLHPLPPSFPPSPESLQSPALIRVVQKTSNFLD